MTSQRGAPRSRGDLSRSFYSPAHRCLHRGGASCRPPQKTAHRQRRVDVILRRLAQPRSCRSASAMDLISACMSLIASGSAPSMSAKPTALPQPRSSSARVAAIRSRSCALESNAQSREGPGQEGGANPRTPREMSLQPLSVSLRGYPTAQAGRASRFSSLFLRCSQRARSRAEA